MSAESLLYSNMDFEDTFEDVLDNQIILQDDLNLGDISELGSESESYELLDSLSLMLEHEKGLFVNDWGVIDEFVEDSLDTSFDEDELMALGSSGLNILDFVVGDLPLSSEEFNLNSEGVIATNIFGLDHFGRAIELNTKIGENKENARSLITDNSTLNIVQHFSQTHQKPLTHSHASKNISINDSVTKSNTSMVRSRLGSKGSKMNRGSKGRLLTSKGRPMPIPNEQVMEEHGYTKRHDVSPRGKGDYGSKEDHAGISEQKESNSNVFGKNRVKAIFPKKSVSVVEPKQKQKPKSQIQKEEESFTKTVAKETKKPVSTSKAISTHNSVSGSKSQQIYIPKKGSKSSEECIVAHESHVLSSNHESKLKQKHIPVNSSSFMEQKPKPIELERKMVSILNHCAFNQSHGKHCKTEQMSDKSLKFPLASEESGSSPSVSSVGSSPGSGNSCQESSPEDLSSKIELQHQPEQNCDAKEKHKKKLSLQDYKRLKQKTVTEKTDSEASMNKARNVGDHNYCMPLQDVTDKFPNQVTIKVEQRTPFWKEAEVKIKTKEISKEDIKVTGSQIGSKSEQNAQENVGTSQRNLQPVKTHGDPYKRIECGNFRKRKASPDQSMPKKPAKDPYYANNSWNESVLTAFELPGRRNNKYSNSAGFPSDASTVSSPRQRSRSRSSSVSSSTSSFEERHCRRKRSRTRSPENNYKQRRDYRGPRKSCNQQKAIEERRIVYIGGLPSSYTKSELQRKMERFGTILETSIHQRNRDECYGFVTFATTQQAASAKEGGHTVPGCERFDFSYGGRREFCGTRYSDLDHDAIYKSNSARSNQNSDFQELLRQVMIAQKAKKKS